MINVACKKTISSNIPYLMLLFISISTSMIPTFLGAIFLQHTGFLLDAAKEQKLNAYSLTMGFYFVNSTLGGLLCGYLADYSGPKKVLYYFFFGVILSSILGIYSLIYGNLAFFVLSKVVEGFMLGRVAVMSYLSHLDLAKTIVFRKTELMNAAGLFIGPALCGFLTDFKSLVPLYYYATPIVLVLLMNVFGFFLIKPLGEVSSVVINKDESKPTAQKLYKQPIFIEFMLYQLAWYLYFLAIIPFAMMSLGFSSSQVGILFSTMVLFYMLSLLITQKLPTHIIESLWMKKISVIMLIASLLVIAYFERLIGFMLANICILFASSILMPLYLSTMSRSASQLNHGMTMGIQASIIGISTAIAAFISAPLLNRSLSLPFYLAALLMVVLYGCFCQKKRGN